MLKENEEEKKLTSLKQGGIYHFRNSNGTFKTAVIFPLHPRMAGLSQVILASDWPTDLILTPDWPRDLILTPDWPRDLLLTPDWLCQALKVFEDKSMNLVHIESRLVAGTSDQHEIYLEIDSENSRDWNQIQQVNKNLNPFNILPISMCQLIDTLRGIDLGPRDTEPVLRSASIDWGSCSMIPFPKVTQLATDHPDPLIITPCR